MDRVVGGLVFLRLLLCAGVFLFLSYETIRPRPDDFHLFGMITLGQRRPGATLLALLANGILMFGGPPYLGKRPAVLQDEPKKVPLRIVVILVIARVLTFYVQIGWICGLFLSVACAHWFLTGTLGWTPKQEARLFEQAMVVMAAVLALFFASCRWRWWQGCSPSTTPA